MNFKQTSEKFAIYSLRHIILKQLQRSYNTWKSFRKVNRKVLSHSRIPKNLSILLSPSGINTGVQHGKSRIKRPSSVRPSISSDSPVDFGSRLHRKAQEIEKRKEIIKRSLEPEYSFAPVLSSGTPKWLNSRIKRESNERTEEIAVVSGNTMLQGSHIPMLSCLIEGKLNSQSNERPPNVRPSIRLERKTRRSSAVNESLPKENLVCFKCK